MCSWRRHFFPLKGWMRLPGIGGEKEMAFSKAENQGCSEKFLLTRAESGGDTGNGRERDRGMVATARSTRPSPSAGLSEGARCAVLQE